MLSNLFLMLRHGPTKLNQADEYRGWSNGPDADLNNDGLVGGTRSRKLP